MIQSHICHRGRDDFWFCTLRVLHRFNIFLPLSALCMFGGCWAISRSGVFEPGEARDTAVLLGVINAYELMIITLGLWLVRTRRAVWDGRFLLFLEVLFAVGTAFLAGEFGAIPAPASYFFAGAVWVLAMFKLAVICGVLRMRLGAWHWVSLAVTIGVVLSVALVLPGWAEAGILSRGYVYVGWWLAGLLVATHPGWSIGQLFGGQRMYEPVLRRSLVIVPALALVLHLLAVGWVYRAHFVLAFAGPVLLGLTVCAQRALRPTAIRRWQIVLPLFAVACSLPTIESLMTVAWGVTVSPMRLALAGAALVWAHAFYLHRHHVFNALGTGALCVIMLGATPQQAWQTIRDHTPRTMFGWGVLLVGFAFGLLLLGGWWSIFRPCRRRFRSRQGEVLDRVS